MGLKDMTKICKCSIAGIKALRDCIRSKWNKKFIWVYELHICYPNDIRLPMRGLCGVAKHYVQQKQDNVPYWQSTIWWYEHKGSMINKLTYSETDMVIINSLCLIAAVALQNMVNICLGNGLFAVWHHAITWTESGVLSICLIFLGPSVLI